MLYENWLYTGSLNIKTPLCPPLKGDIESDFLVIGGGFAGLHAALTLADAGKKVILLERSFVGGGSSGKSAGFLVPESEEDMEQLIKSYGEKKANVAYSIPKKGVDLIVNTAKKNNFNCDLRKQDSLFISVKESHNEWIKLGAKIKRAMGLSYEIYDKKSLRSIHPGKGYLSGLKYPGSYGINSFAYCQEMKNLLLKKGVKIYEDSEVHKLEGNTAKTRNTARTHLGSVTAKKILICVDKLKSEIDEDLSKKYYHLQTYLAVSEPLDKKEIKSLFPKGELMCWDTRMIYMHYRLIGGNRILIGGSSPWAYYYPRYLYSPKVIQKFIDELKERFPEIKDVEFTHYWSGLIDVTKDLMPIVDYDKRNKSIQYALGSAGLNLAAYCGDYIARRAMGQKNIKDLSEF
ncbi:MAG: FAD-dependent oxidoreductase, partial [Candidatus Pacearchaeota archaeon]|nr:FAD-dependent oxidoreductase [Candidatus Pacearchaeota archaeon]